MLDVDSDDDDDDDDDESKLKKEFEFVDSSHIDILSPEFDLLPLEVQVSHEEHRTQCTRPITLSSS